MIKCPKKFLIIFTILMLLFAGIAMGEVEESFESKTALSTEITLTVDEKNPLFNQPVHLKVKANRPMAKIQLMGSRSAIYTTEGAMEYIIELKAEKGTENVYVNVLLAEENTWQTTEPVSWETAFFGQLESPVLDKKKVTISKGEMLMVRVLNTAHSREFYSCLYSENGRPDETATSAVNDNRIIIATWNLNSQETYTLEVWQNADYGYEPASIPATLEIRVIDPEEMREPYIEASEEYVKTGETVILTAGVPEHDELWIVYDYNAPLGDGTYGQGMVCNTFSSDNAGEYVFYAAYYNEVTGDFVKTDAYVTITVEAKETILISLPHNLRKIDKDAFAGSTIAGITIPADCEEIGTGAFKNCSKLRCVVFDGMKTKFGSDVFVGCSYFSFRCLKGSDAESYAVENGIPLTWTLIE